MAGKIFLIFMAILAGFSVSVEPDFSVKSTNEEIAESFARWRVEALLNEFAGGEKSYPVTGHMVMWVQPDSLAERLGINTGAVLLPVGRFDERFRGNNRIQPEDPDEINFIEWVTPNNKSEKSAVPEGMIGVTSFPCRNMVNWYLKYGQRGADWDMFVVTALYEQGYNVDLAESCWAIAIESGYKPDRLSNWSGAFIAVHHGGFDAARKFMEAYGQVVNPENEKQFPTNYVDWWDLCYQTGDYKKLVEASKEFTKNGPKPEDADWLFKMSVDSPRKEKSPIQLADEMQRKTFLSDPQSRPKWADQDRVRYPNLLKKAKAAAE